MFDERMSHANLRTIVYASTAVRPMDLAALEALLAQARNLNRESDVTVLLVYCDGTFLQCLEGEAAELEITYARILGSRRHHRIVELLNAPIAGRSFTEWRMAFALPTAAEMGSLMKTSWARMHQDYARDWSDAVGLSFLRKSWAATWRARTPQWGAA
jgi:hypothetical protein